MKDVTLLKQALPYIRKFKGKIFVVKFGGNLAQDKAHLESLAEDISLIHQVGIKLVVVHGGGPQATELSRKLGVEPKMVNGRRVTTDEVLEVAKMVYAGKINVEILSALLRHETNAVGISGVDGGMVRTKKREAVFMKGDAGSEDEMVDFGHVGDIESVDAEVVRVLMDGGYIPVVASLGGDNEGNVYNINADTVAAAIATELKAEKFINMTSANGVLRDSTDPSSTISHLTIDDVTRLENDGTISGGMLPKVASCVAAVNGGVRRAHIVNGLVESALLLEVFTKVGKGTMIIGANELAQYHDALMDGSE